MLLILNKFAGIYTGKFLRAFKRNKTKIVWFKAFTLFFHMGVILVEYTIKQIIFSGFNDIHTYHFWCCVVANLKNVYLSIKMFCFWKMTMKKAKPFPSIVCNLQAKVITDHWNCVFDFDILKKIFLWSYFSSQRFNSAQLTATVCKLRTKISEASVS